MSDTAGIMSLEITKRLNEPGTSFSLEYVADTTPAAFTTGNLVSFGLVNPSSPSSLYMCKAYILNLEKSRSVASTHYTLTGTDVGYYLGRQPFSLDCSINNEKLITSNQLITLILQDTNINISRRHTQSGYGIRHFNLSNKYGETPWFCGKFSTKRDALDYFYRIYAGVMGKPRYHWYVDMAGDLRWFHTTGYHKHVDLVLHDNDERLVDYTITENAENIINDLWGYAGEDSEHKVHYRDQRSVDQYGLLCGDDVNDSTMSQAQMNLEVKRQLSLHSAATFTLQATLKNYPLLQPGMRVRFPDDTDLGGKTLIVNETSIHGSPTDYNLTFTATNDQTVLNQPNTFEVMKAVAQKVVDDNKAEVGTVKEIDEDKNVAVVELQNTKEKVMAKYIR